MRFDLVGFYGVSTILSYSMPNLGRATSLGKRNSRAD